MHQEWSAWAELAAPDYRFDPGVGPVRDLPATLAWSRAIFSAFPDYQQDLQCVVANGQRVVGYAVARGTHTGALDLGLGAVLQPTGRAFELPYFKLLCFDGTGRMERDFQHMSFGDLAAALTGTTPAGS